MLTDGIPYTMATTSRVCSLSPLSSVSATLKVGVAPVLLSLCPNGFTVGLTAVRVTQPSQSATCSMAVAGAAALGEVSCFSWTRSPLPALQ